MHDRIDGAGCGANHVDDNRTDHDHQPGTSCHDHDDDGGSHHNDHHYNA